jgi:hypothetical protein
VRDGDIDVLMIDGQYLEWRRRADEQLQAAVTGSIQLVAIGERAAAAGISTEELSAMVLPVLVTNACCSSARSNPELHRPGQVLMADKGYRRASFKAELANAGITLIRASTFGAAKPRPGQHLLPPFRQIIESVNQTLKAQLDLERPRRTHQAGGLRTRPGASWPSPPPSGTTRPPDTPARPAASPPTTTDLLEPTV